jgi:hypothetical protein
MSKSLFNKKLFVPKGSKWNNNDVAIMDTTYLNEITNYPKIERARDAKY